MPETPVTQSDRAASAEPRVSIVVPVLNEEDNVVPLAEQVGGALADEHWELIFVDDGSTDQTASRVGELGAADGRVRLVQLARTYGQSTAMQAGFDHARGRYVVTMDGDLQNDPRDIPRLLQRIDEGYDLVAGYRERRQDRFVTRKVPSWIANRVIQRVTGVRIRDNGCSLKAYTRELLGQVRLYSDLHRFIPALAAGVAGARISEVGVRHHPRRHGTSKYGLSRIGKVLADLITIKMIRTFRLRPLLLYSLGAAVSAGIGAVSAAIAVAARFGQDADVLLVYPTMSLMAIALGVYLLMLGLVGEVVVRRAGGDRRRLPILRPARVSAGGRD